MIVVLQRIRLRLLAWYLRARVDIASFFRRIIGTPRYATRFHPDRSFKIPSTVSPRTIKVNVFEPDEFDANKKYPVYMNFHGSGFVFHFLGMDADFCRFVSKQTGAVVLDCDYAKAPEYPFPAAPQDVKDIVAHVVSNREGYFDTSKLAIGGFSAGGNLALASCMNQPENTLKAIIAFYPPTDLSGRAKRLQPKGVKSTLTQSMMEFSDDSYCPPGVNRSDAQISPIMIPVSSFPQHLFIVTCGQDPLQYEAIELIDVLEKGGKHVVKKHIPGVGHAWDKVAQGGTVEGKAKHDSYVAAVDVLKTVFQK